MEKAPSSGEAVVFAETVGEIGPIDELWVIARRAERLEELRIGVMVLCPFWTKTEFFNRAIPADKAPVVKKYIAMYEPEDLVKRGWRDLKRGRDVSFFGFKAMGQVLLVKLLPHKLVMNVWLKQQGLEK